MVEEKKAQVEITNNRMTYDEMAKEEMAEDELVTDEIFEDPQSDKKVRK